MADDVTITGGANSTPLDGTVIATDDIGGVHYQRMKLVMGADGAADMDVDSGQQTKANSLPVTLASDEDALPVTVAALPLPAGAATAANQVTAITSLQLIDDLRNALDSVGIDELDVNVEASVLPAGAATSANQTTMITSLQLIDDLRNALDSVATDELHTKEQVGLVIDEYDFVDCGYIAGDLTSVVYRTGGAGGVIVATLALAYVAGDLDTITKT